MHLNCQLSEDFRFTSFKASGFRVLRLPDAPDAEERAANIFEAMQALQDGHLVCKLSLQPVISFVSIGLWAK